MKFSAANHGFGESAIHLQFTPKKRRKLFMNTIVQEACRTSFQEIALHWGLKLEACEFGPDHVHIFITHWKNFAIPQLAQFFKGASSRKIRQDFPDICVIFRIPDSFWSDGYFFETCGSVTAEARKFYIERMQVKHWVPN